jgi:hypothetical protein
MPRRPSPGHPRNPDKPRAGGPQTLFRGFCGSAARPLHGESIVRSMAPTAHSSHAAYARKAESRANARDLGFPSDWYSSWASRRRFRPSRCQDRRVGRGLASTLASWPASSEVTSFLGLAATLCEYDFTSRRRLQEAARDPATSHLRSVPPGHDRPTSVGECRCPCRRSVRRGTVTRQWRADVGDRPRGLDRVSSRLAEL